MAKLLVICTVFVITIDDLRVHPGLQRIVEMLKFKGVQVIPTVPGVMEI